MKKTIVLLLELFILLVFRLKKQPWFACCPCIFAFTEDQKSSMQISSQIRLKKRTHAIWNRNTISDTVCSGCLSPSSLSFCLSLPRLPLWGASYVSPCLNMNIWLNWQTHIVSSLLEMTYLLKRKKKETVLSCHQVANLKSVFINCVQVLVIEYLYEKQIGGSHNKIGKYQLTPKESAHLCQI